MFVTGSAEGYKLTSVDLQILLVHAGGSTDPTYTVTIRESTASGKPGTSLGTLSNPATLSSGVLNWPASGDGIDLAADTRYIVVVDVDSSARGDRPVVWSTTTSTLEDGAAGWIITNGSLSRLNSAVSPDEFIPTSSSEGIFKITVNGYAKDTTAPDPAPAPNGRPTVSASCEPCEVMPGGEVRLTATASDPDGDSLAYAWSASEGSFSGATATARWTAPDRMGDVLIRVTVSDGSNSASDTVTVTVVSAEAVPTLPVAASWLLAALLALLGARSGRFARGRRW